MAATTDSELDPEQDLSSRCPTACTILFGLIIFVAVLTWIIPADHYERVMSEEVGNLAFIWTLILTMFISAALSIAAIL